jgi:hypothetical protein
MGESVASFLVDDSKLFVVDGPTISRKLGAKLRTQASAFVGLRLTSASDCNYFKNNRSMYETDTMTGKPGLLSPKCCR